MGMIRRNPCCHPRGSPRPCRDHIGADRCSVHLDRWALCSCLHRRRSTRLHCHRPGTCPGCLPPTHLRTHQFACLSGWQWCGQDFKKRTCLCLKSTWTRNQTTSRANCSVLNILLELKLAHWDVRHRLTLASCVCFQWETAGFSNLVLSEFHQYLTASISLEISKVKIIYV